MTISPVSLVVSLGMVEFALSLIFATLFVGFHRLYRRTHLRYWSYSFIAASLHSVLSVLAMYTAVRLSDQVMLRTIESMLSLAAAYPAAIWLLAGAYIAATQKRMPMAHVRLWVIGAAMFGGATALLYAFDPGASDLRMFFRVELRAFLVGIAMFLGGIYLLLIKSEQPGFGQRLLGVAFLVFSAQAFVTFTVFLSQRLLSQASGFAPYLGFIDIVALSLVGLALVIWLLEEERNRARTANRKLYHLSFHDPLTGLPNRKLFLERLSHAIERGSEEENYAVLLINLDRFRLLNESLGHSRADKLLALVGDRLLHRARQVDTVARVGVDEFALLLREKPDGQKILNASNKLLKDLREPYELNGREILMTASFGLSRFPDDGKRPDQLIANAAAAMQRAKEQGGDKLVPFSEDMGGKAHEQLDFEGDLRRALERDEFTLLYQPVIDANDNRVLGFEALLRWKHPRRGLLAPDSFIPLAESLGLMDSITRWVLAESCQQVHSWRRRFDMPLWIAVNLSASAFRQADLVDQIFEVLGQTKLDAEDLICEITENVAMENFESGVVTLEQMRQRGVRIAIDDFGTGFSSLSYLRRLPVDKVKLDKEFIHELSEDIGSLAIVNALVPLAHQLGMKVVAEGVETREQLSQLREAGCDEIQGFLMYEPMPPATCESMLESVSAARYFKDEVI
ncbi:MAG: bifunctional diguanylate cyclase/phosphodiesterase [Xanthomonadales bacterium]|nr:bifunctional diguanylate cyclase/phosphodiesterase [Xanthomonadales bacterium]